MTKAKSDKLRAKINPNAPITSYTRLSRLSQVYEGLRYRLSLEFPAGYPYQAPRVKFVTPCFHPNVDEQGFICLDILKDKWSALYDVRSILLSVQSLLGGNQFKLVSQPWTKSCSGPGLVYMSPGGFNSAFT